MIPDTHGGEQVEQASPTGVPATEPGWARRFRAPAILLASGAIDAPGVALVTSTRSGVPQLYRWDIDSGALTQLTDAPAGRILGYLTPDARWVAWLDDTAGDEIGHWAVAPVEGGAPVDLTPGLAPYASEAIAFSRRGGCVAMVTAADDRLNLMAGQLGNDGRVDGLRSLHGTHAGLGEVALSSDGRLAAVSSAHRSSGLEYSVLTFSTDDGSPGPELWDGEGTSIVVHDFGPGVGDRRLLATTNASGQERAFVWNVDDGRRHDLPADAPGGDLIALGWSPEGEDVLLCHIHAARQRLHVWQPETGAIRRLDHPEGVMVGAFRRGAGWFLPNGGDIIARWEDPGTPRHLVALDRMSGRMTSTLLPAGDVPPGRPLRSIAFRSADGTVLQAWLGVPEGDPPYPTILETHGGPTAATFAAFDPSAQAFLDEGFAFLSLNYRGSTTFGRDFEQAIWGRLGELELQDMAAARTWLLDEGIAVPDQILLTGWSYGGYLTLLGLGRQPDLWAGGMAGVAIADWQMSYEDSSDLLRSYQRMLFGGDPESRGEAMRTGSPLTYVDDVRAPVLIIQGKNDTRTPARPVERYVEALRARSHPVEIEWFDAGHMGIGNDLAIEHQALMHAFATRIVGLRNAE
jgi:dipeptidyl aminopeptidase/acylaminoacyl peptidase